MKKVNLKSIIQAFSELNQPLYETFFIIHQITPDIDELEDLKSFVEQMDLVCMHMDVFDGYFLNYIIPQIGKEFDLLRFGTDSVVNIELKSESTPDKIKRQLVRNQYYLSFLGKEVICYTYVTNEKNLYSLDDNQNLIKKDFKGLSDVLIEQNRIDVPVIDNLFNPSNYLVSPFNSTERFVEGSYFLTNHQEKIRNEILGDINNQRNFFFSICGKAGTGKTLLTYDLAKEFSQSGYRVLIIHCGKLNGGHYKLREDYGWEIVSIRDWASYKLSDFFLVIVDEAQRIWPSDLIPIINQVKSNQKFLIFSYDQQQCLRSWEVNNNIEQQITDQTSAKKFKLTEKIRTNREIASFITALFDTSKEIEALERNNVELNYFRGLSDAKKHMDMLRREGWKIINHTPSNRHNHPYMEYIVPAEDNAHGVIGQEFDKVVAVIDPYFCYNESKLSIRDYKHKPHYDPIMMLFQILTRTRKKLSIVVINNPEVMQRCLDILKQ